MEDFSEKILNQLRSVGKPIDVVNVDFSHHVPTLLRSWAAEIESGDISVKQAVVIIDALSPDLQKINLVMTNKKS